MLIALVVAGCYWRVLDIPLVQDDWSLFAAFERQSPGHLLRSIIDPDGRLFFRPLGILALRLEYALFGDSASGYRIVGLSLHLTNSLLVAVLLARLLSSQASGIACGLLFAAAGAVHLESLLWAVGLYDLGALLLTLVCVVLALEGRFLVSAVSWGAAVLFKEAVVLLPAAVLFLAFVQERGTSARTRTTRWLWRVAAFGACGSATLPFIAPGLLRGASSGPYASGVSAGLVFDNAARFGRWYVQSFAPVTGTLNLVLGVLLAGLVVMAWLLPGNGLLLAGKAQARWLVAALVFWLVLALLPVLVLRQHAYRYYGLHALPPLLGLAALGVRSGLFRLSSRPTTRALVVSVLTAAIVSASALRTNTTLAAGRESESFADGTNGLVRRASLVRGSREAVTNDDALAAASLFLLCRDIGPALGGGELALGHWLGKGLLSSLPEGAELGIEGDLMVIRPKEGAQRALPLSEVALLTTEGHDVRAFLVDDLASREAALENCRPLESPLTPQ